MKVLVAYDTVSPNRNTEKIAKDISDVLAKGKAIEVECSNVKDIDSSAAKGYDCFLIGSPTMFWKPTGAIMKFLGGVAQEEVEGKPAASFDTQYEGWFAGNGAKRIEKKLRGLGLRIIRPSLIAYVEGRGSAVRLKKGELEKAANFAKEIASSLSPG